MKRNRLNFTTLMGASIAVAVVYYGGIKTVKNPAMFLDTHAILLVVGGTMAATFLAYPLSHLSQLLDFIFFSVFTRKKTDYITLVEEFAEINHAMKTNNHNIRYKDYSHNFLKEGVSLLFEKTYSYDDVSDILEDRAMAFKKKYQQDAKILNAIAKYPPAFGLLGATTGMISMMTNLGGPGGTSAIGQAMALALVATFWGIAVANFVLLPLSDNAQKAFQSDEFTRNFIKEGILLVKKDTQQRVFIERLCSMLSLEERVLARSNNPTTAETAVPQNIVDLFQKQSEQRRIAKLQEKQAELEAQENGPAATVQGGSQPASASGTESVGSKAIGSEDFKGLNFKNLRIKRRG